MKRCFKCNTHKELNKFYKNRARYDGYCNMCKECDKKRPKNKEKAAQRSKKWRESKKGKEYFKNYYLENKELYYARNKKWCEENRERYREHRRKNANKESTKKRHKFQEAKRRAQKLNTTPKWANLDKIKEIYQKCPEGYHVDHIIPLNNPIVCGLHVENNLQYLLAIENIRKNNKLEERYVCQNLIKK